ncbi:type II toxin-antitoxin system VapC family toxin [Infirmifilum lucidum]|uniref:Type II toxin-antitoxin system VapC family toxin n=1 Tax=Infirmifilum lucidum TaxID=2776706 RepID=A0A7L9FGM0_9CREN|nr:type II toxin-antitoxin system VapC family toxin [Infirmifilum lucidum]QOJ78950.1 type II toxin-antitoxin system VapC family toxin [Infirmifilum lucidum]
MTAALLYLDSSAIVKRYVIEPGKNLVDQAYYEALRGDALLSFSMWNIGEVLGVLDKYYKRGWLDRDDYLLAKRQFLFETLRLLKLGVLRIVPVKARLLIEAWDLIEKYHLYEADALQILSAKHVGAERLYTGDKILHEVALKEGLESEYAG